MRNSSSLHSARISATRPAGSCPAASAPVFDDALLRSVSSVVEYTLRKNATDWITDEMVADVYSETLEHIVNKANGYDPEKGASFRTWICTVAKNYAISAAERLYRENRRLASLESVIVSDNVDDWDYLCGTADEALACDHDAMDQEPEWFDVRSSLDSRGDAMSWDAKVEWFRDRTEECLSAGERELFAMLLNGASNSQIVELTGKSRGSVDTAISRLRAKCRAINQEWLRHADRVGLE